MKLGLKLKKSIVVAAAMIASASAFANPLVSATVTGYATGYDSTSATTFVPTVYSTGLSGSTLDTLLLGNAASPGGNVELGRLGGSVTTLTGMFGSAIVTISSLTAADWTTALATSYISAAAKSIGVTLDSGQMSTAVSTFLGASSAWKRVSDPNIAYVNYANGLMSIGLAGYYDAAPVLASLFGSAPAGSQASEVVKVSVNGGPAEYLFSFTGTQSGLTNNVGSFTGNYEVTKAVPEPTSIALLGLGLVGMVAMRRRKAKQA